MKDVDPEVAALLDDLPKSTLPPALIKEGWGRYSVSDMRRAGKVSKTPSETQAPNYIETCVQCGRPITNARQSGGWWDHAGKTECDGALVAEKFWDQHYPQSDVDRVKVYVDEEKQRLARYLRQSLYRDEEQAKKEARQKALKNGPCGANKHGHSCPHECGHKGQHFGFHECKYCRYLWK